MMHSQQPTDADDCQSIIVMGHMRLYSAGFCDDFDAPH